MVIPVHNIHHYQKQQITKNSSGGRGMGVRNGSQPIPVQSSTRLTPASGGYKETYQPYKSSTVVDESPTSVFDLGGFNSSIRNAYQPWTPPSRVSPAIQAAESDTPWARDDASLHDAITAEESVDPSPSETLPERFVPKKEDEPVNDCFFISNSGVRMLSERTSKWIEEFEEKRRKETAEHRISQALIGLRAASERSASLENFRQDDSLRGSLREPHDCSCLRDMVGDIGLAIFSPLDENAFEPLKSARKYSCERRMSRLIMNGEPNEVLEDDEIEEYPVELMPENPLTLKSCPRLLSHKMMQQMSDEALPEIVKTMRWKRIFAIGRDGDAFCTMNQCCASFKHTIVVVQTSDGHLLGGYATELWQRQEGHNMGRSFFGSGQSFLFSNHPSVAPYASGYGSKESKCVDDDCERELSFFKWTGSNRYCQIFDVDSGLLAMGGGGAFGLIVEENFSRGGTGHCDTFGNPPLIPTRDERFDIANFEVYGFVSASQSVAPPNSPVARRK